MRSRCSSDSRCRRTVATRRVFCAGDGALDGLGLFQQRIDTGLDHGISLIILLADHLVIRLDLFRPLLQLAESRESRIELVAQRHAVDAFEHASVPQKDSIKAAIVELARHEP